MGSAISNETNELYCSDENNRSEFIYRFFGQDSLDIAKKLILQGSYDPSVWAILMIYYKTSNRIEQIKKNISSLLTGTNSNLTQFTTLKERNEFAKYLLIEPLNRLLWISKINELIKNFSITNQIGPICWSHALATAINLSTSRIIGRNVEQFVVTRNKLLVKVCNLDPRRKYEKEELNEIFKKTKVTDIKYQEIMQEILPEYGLHFNEVVKFNDLYDILRNGRVCIVTFSLNGYQWINFSKFYNNENTKSKAITYNDLNRKLFQFELQGRNLEPGGHAVILESIEGDEMTLINSWGSDWAINGRFKVKLDAFQQIHFYDVFWYENELSSSERNLYEIRCSIAEQKFIKIIDNIEPSFIRNIFCVSAGMALLGTLLDFFSSNQSDQRSFIEKLFSSNSLLSSYDISSLMPKEVKKTLPLKENLGKIILLAIAFEFLELKVKLKNISNEFWGNQSQSFWDIFT